MNCLTRNCSHGLRQGKGKMMREEKSLITLNPIKKRNDLDLENRIENRILITRNLDINLLLKNPFLSLAIPRVRLERNPSQPKAPNWKRITVRSVQVAVVGYPRIIPLQPVIGLWIRKLDITTNGKRSPGKNPEPTANEEIKRKNFFLSSVQARKSRINREPKVRKMRIPHSRAIF
jgi:hypothetical protein